MKEIKKSLDYAHAEIEDLKLKNENKSMKLDQAKAAERIGNLERDNNTLRDKVIDLQARSMRDVATILHVVALKHSLNLNIIRY
jgi:FtsZ-binding cell division protein ZapB